VIHSALPGRNAPGLVRVAQIPQPRTQHEHGRRHLVSALQNAPRESRVQIRVPRKLQICPVSRAELVVCVLLVPVESELGQSVV
jgi:hypothetical protein